MGVCSLHGCLDKQSQLHQETSTRFVDNLTRGFAV